MRIRTWIAFLRFAWGVSNKVAGESMKLQHGGKPAVPDQKILAENSPPLLLSPAPRPEPGRAGGWTDFGNTPCQAPASVAHLRRARRDEAAHGRSMLVGNTPCKAHNETDF